MEGRAELAVTGVDQEAGELKEVEGGGLVALSGHVHEVDVLLVLGVKGGAHGEKVAEEGEVAVEGGEVEGGEAFFSAGVGVYPGVEEGLSGGVWGGAKNLIKKLI